MNEQHTNLMYSALIAGALIGSFFSPYLPVANGQSLMNQMSMTNGNETATSQNMTMPQLNLGVVTMPVVCTSLGEVLGVLGSAVNMTLGGGGGGGNETQEDIMDMMMQEMMPGGVSNMTESDIQELHNVTENMDPGRIMNLQLCSLMTDEKMAEELLMKK
jgi:hypothetical protein